MPADSRHCVQSECGVPGSVPSKRTEWVTGPGQSCFHYYLRFLAAFTDAASTSSTSGAMRKALGPDKYFHHAGTFCSRSEPKLCRHSHSPPAKRVETVWEGPQNDIAPIPALGIIHGPERALSARERGILRALVTGLYVRLPSFPIEPVEITSSRWRKAVEMWKTVPTQPRRPFGGGKRRSAVRMLPPLLHDS